MKILKNTTVSDIFIIDVGINLLASTNYTIPPQEYNMWAASTNIDTYINNGNIVVNDGYDDLKIDLAKKNIHNGTERESNYIVSASLVTLTNSTLTLTADSKLLYVFSGSTAGQIIKLPDATTLNIGYKYEFWNTGSQSITINNYSSVSIFTLAAYQKTWLVLQDNSTSAGTWLIEANYMSGTGSGSGTICFGFDGTASLNRILEIILNVPSQTTGYVVAGSKAIRAVSIAGAVGSTYTTTVTLYKNLVAFEKITLSAQRTNTKLNLNHQLVNLDELSAKVTSGSVSKPVVVLWI